jgi:predicted GNAT family acetyltransferase
LRTIPHPLDNAVWEALTTFHAGFAEARGPARRYAPDVSVFSAVDRFDADAWHALAALAEDGGEVVLFRADVEEPPPGWTTLRRGLGNQLLLDHPLTAVADARIRRLGSSDVDHVLALIAVTQPGPFRRRTIELGDYVGLFDDERLVAMAGERLHLPGYTEISAVATHPDARRRGLAAALVASVAANIATRGETPFLHVAEGNDEARRVYERLGFRLRRQITFAALAPPG